MIDLQSIILTYVNDFSYLGIFLLLAVIVFLPIPEEIVLLLIGYFAGFGFIGLYKAIIVSFLGVLLGDNLFYFFSKRSSKFVNKLKKKIVKNRLRKYEKNMHNHMGKTIFVLRFVLGLRFLGPLMAGSMRVKWSKFFFYNLLAVLIFVPLFVLLGFHFHTILAFVISKVTAIRDFVFVLILIILFLCISLFLNKRFLNSILK